MEDLVRVEVGEGKKAGEEEFQEEQGRRVQEVEEDMQEGHLSGTINVITTIVLVQQPRSGRGL